MLFGSVLFAQDDFGKFVGGLCCLGIIVLPMIAGIIKSINDNKRVRCDRCGYRTKKGEISEGRCPNCNSLELSED
ncbi:MAG: hypothetical protein EBZ67_16830 [Chitinophagia bacterium]|nr:hypothetical protein [Chitinophagia bacterium]